MNKIFVKHRSFISYFSFSIATSAVGFISTMILMRLIPPEEYGRIAIFMSIQFFSVPIISFAGNNLVAINKARLGKPEYEHFRRSYVSLAYLMFLAMQFLFIALYVLGLLHDRLFLLVPIVGIVRFLIGLASMEFVMEEKSVQYGMVGFSTALISLLLTVLLVINMSGVADWRISALLISDILFVFVRYYGRLKLIWTFTFDKDVFKDIARFGLPLLVSVVPAWALNESDKIIVAKYTDMVSVGYYAAAMAIAGIMITFNVAMLNSSIPKIYQALGDKPERMMETIKLYVKKLVGASAAFGVFFAIVYGFTAGYILPEKYAAARLIVFVAILFSLGRSFYAVLGLVTDYYGMTVVKLKGIIYGGVTTVLAVVLGVKYFGVIGAAVGAGTGYFVLSYVLWFELVGKSRQIARSRDLNG